MVTSEVRIVKSVEAHKPAGLVYTMRKNKRTCIHMVERTNTQGCPLTHTHTLGLTYTHKDRHTDAHIMYPDMHTFTKACMYIFYKISHFFKHLLKRRDS